MPTHNTKIFHASYKEIIGGIVLYLILFAPCLWCLYALFIIPLKAWWLIVTLAYTAWACWECYDTVKMLFGTKFIIEDDRLHYKKSFFQYDSVKLEDITKCCIKSEPKSYKSLLHGSSRYVLSIYLNNAKTLRFDVTCFSAHDCKSLKNLTNR